MKKIIAAFLILSLVLALAACAQTKPKTDTVPVYAPPPEPEEISLEPEYYAFEAQYIRTNGYREGECYPRALVIDSKAALEGYCAENARHYDFTRGFYEAIQKYDSAWFDAHELIIVVLEEGSGSIYHEVTRVFGLGDASVDITQFVPEVCTDDMAEWHILIELGRLFDTDANILVNITEVSQMQKYLHIGDKLGFSMLMPEDWSCDATCGHIETVSFCPPGAESGFTVSCSNEKFAVCGTGLTEREMQLNDATKVYVGYYDGSENWSYVSFRSVDEYCSVINNGLTGDDANTALEAIKTMKFYSGKQVCTSETSNPVTIDPRFAQVLNDVKFEHDTFSVSVFITLPEGRCLSDETRRLRGYGINMIEGSDADVLTGHLTASQILNFPVYNGCLYEIKWNGVNEPQTNSATVVTAVK